jgi:predicted DNA-binding WGR domain protein
MIAQPYELRIERRDPGRNMARYYVLSIRPTLFGEIELTRRWGRIGARGQSLNHVFSREDDAVRLFLDLLRRKRKRGYGPRSVVAAAHTMKVRERSPERATQQSVEAPAAATT